MKWPDEWRKAGLLSGVEKFHLIAGNLENYIDPSDDFIKAHKKMEAEIQALDNTLLEDLCNVRDEVLRKLRKEKENN